MGGGPVGSLIPFPDRCGGRGPLASSRTRAQRAVLLAVALLVGSLAWLLPLGPADAGLGTPLEDPPTDPTDPGDPPPDPPPDVEPPPPPDPPTTTTSVIETTTTTVVRQTTTTYRQVPTTVVEIVETTTTSTVPPTSVDLLVPGDGTEGAESTTTTQVELVSSGDDGPSDGTLIAIVVTGLVLIALVVGILTWRYWVATRPYGPDDAELQTV